MKGKGTLKNNQKKKDIANIMGLSRQQSFMYFLVVMSFAALNWIQNFSVYTNEYTLSNNSRTKRNLDIMHQEQGKDQPAATNSSALIMKGGEGAPDTSIIILSSLIPTHPSIKMINDTFNSLSMMLDGIPFNTPIHISVDGLPIEKNIPDNIHRLHEYVKSLRLRFNNNPYVTIINNYEHGHISNSIRVALEVVQTEFVYVLQHDLMFIKHINHTALIKTMRERPSEVQIVRFGVRIWQGMPYQEDCKNGSYIESNGINLERGKWSDHNHFTTKAYYEKLLADIGPKNRFPEAPMMQKAKIKGKKDCSYIFQYLYNMKDGPFIKHLDGRKNTSYRH
jgi:hypothetical protein